MFSDEKVITVATINGKEECFFVPKTETQEDCVRVKVLYNYDSHTCVVLPTDYHDTITVEFSAVNYSSFV